MQELIEIIIEIQSFLTKDLLKKEYLDKNKENNLFGHCYVATETLYHLLPRNEQDVFKPSILKVDGITHWFLKNIENGLILDPTAKQFDFTLDYSNAKRCFFLTTTPSKRTLILINRINEKNCN